MSVVSTVTKAERHHDQALSAPERYCLSMECEHRDSGNSSVNKLSLSGFGISTSGFLPFVCEIKSLQSLDVSNNFLTSIPDKFMSDCGGIDGLKLLNFSKNRLAGSLPTFSGFGGLESLDLSFNSLSGDISLQLNGLVSLKRVNLGFNKFNGTLPMSLGNSTMLEQLVLSANLLGGTIPKEIPNYQNLKVIDLSVNQLSGTIPYSIGNLSKLETLVLSVNKLFGDIPPTIANISTLYRFVANQNQFAGTIPSGLTRFLSYLDLSYNKLGGIIPAELLSQPNLVHVDLSYNLLEGSIPENLSSSLFRLRLGINYLNGSIPSSFASLKNLTYLELDNNSLTSGIPGELGSCQSLALLNLAQNELKGSLPTSLGNLTKLEILKLQMNKLDGEIPVEITKLSKLSTLNISWNSLMGVIPPSISNLGNLAHLYLQGNNLNGPIPNTMSRMRSLLELQLGQNQLSGSIRQLPLTLQIALNLSSNLFDGTIPGTLSQLTDLEVLDLSNNRFSGAIPDSLTQLSSLTQLILSNNQLSGIVPDFRSFTAVQLSGNLGLVNKSGNASQGSLKKKKPIALDPIALAVIPPMASAEVTRTIARAIGNAVVDAMREKGRGGWWFTPHMAAASRAIAQRLSLVDFVLEVRDARIPLSSEFHLLRNYSPAASSPPRRIIVLNKTDLANRSQLKEWVKYFDQLNCISYGVNSHNKDNVKEFLNFLQAQVRELKRADHSSYTATMMIVGIPNVGKSALASSLHQIGRISAEEKGKLKHVTVSPHPGETRDISSLKNAGSIRDCLVGEKELAKYFLAVLNLSDEYKKWEKLTSYHNDESLEDHKAECLSGSGSDMKQKKHYLTDHTQDFIVNDVRRSLFGTISCFGGDVQAKEDLDRLIEVQFSTLREAFKVLTESSEDANTKVATKLLNLYRTGRLGHYTLDPFAVSVKAFWPMQQ
ncbi:hypothetical protein Tsubulata_013325 [Turnera subulata]|uniref:G domain-containing protein n=1 Tax=Turnera subulata TaxID=218843 RepID=A0A9Q0G3R4_9ROSI|nr:hypothetical protein Tsubulata_013325 [Turnera subulata]